MRAPRISLSFVAALLTYEAFPQDGSKLLGIHFTSAAGAQSPALEARIIVSARSADGASLRETFDLTGVTVEDIVATAAQELRSKNWDVQTRATTLAVLGHRSTPISELGVWENSTSLDAALELHYERTAGLNFLGLKVTDESRGNANPGTLVFKNHDQPIVCKDIAPNSNPQAVLELLRSRLGRQQLQVLTEVPGIPRNSPQDQTLVLDLDDVANLPLIDPTPADFSFLIMNGDGGPMLSLVLPRVPFMRGSIDDELGINITDARVMLDMLFQGAQLLPCVKAIDINDDGRTNLADAVHLLSYLFLSGTKPAPPNSDCAFEWTQDDLPCTETNCPGE
jgi:hypothetical protein